MRKKIRIGTRGSLLALTQTRQIQKKLKAVWPSIHFSIVIVKTTGDEFQTVELFKKNNTGVFTKELERKLLENKIDIAVHSLKDLPTDLPTGLALASFPKREDVRDVLITPKGLSLGRLPKGALVGTASPRRQRQLYRARPDLKFVDIRGNLDTRVRRVVVEKKYDAILVARAGLLRTGRYLKYSNALAPEIILPAVGQAALALEVRANDAVVVKIVRELNHRGTEKQVTAERELLKSLHGGCRVPLGVYSKIKGDKIHLKASVFSVRNDRFVDGSVRFSAKKCREAGRALAKLLLKKGANKFLAEARSGS